MSTSDAQPNPKLQFSLRTLFLLTILVCLVLGVTSTPETMMTIVYTCYIGIALAVAGLAYRRPWLIVFGVAAIAMSIPLHNVLSSWKHNWDGTIERTVSVIVVDDDSGKPIPSTTITLAHDGVNRYVTMISDYDGTATFDWAFFTSGKDYVLWKTGNIHIGWEQFLIKYDGYSPQTLLLSDRTGNKLPLDSSIPQFTIKLKKSAQ